MTTPVQSAVQQALSGSGDKERERTEFARQRVAWAEGIETLYKLRPLSPGEAREHTLDIIEHSRVYFSSPTEFNDPFDCFPRFEVTGQDWLDLLPGLDEFERLITEEGVVSRRQLEKLPTAERDRLADILREYTLSDLRRETRMLCLAKEHRHPLMWSHYAAGHTGICLHFRVARGNVFGDARGVVYQRERRSIVVPPPTQADRDEWHDRFNLEKADFWSYECEYRVITHPKREPRIHFDARNRVMFPPDQLCGITLGLKVSDDDRNLILRLATERQSPVPVWLARESRDHFWLDIEQIQD